MQSTDSSRAEPQIPLARVGAFVRQLAHDVRNGLNAIDLESAYLQEIVTDEEAKEETKKLRGMVTNTAKLLQNVSSLFSPAPMNRMSCAASMLVEEMRAHLMKLWPEEMTQVEWDAQLGAETVEIDFNAINAAATELFRNAFQFRASGEKIAFRALIEPGTLTMQLIEGKSTPPEPPPEKWGAEMFVSTRRGGFGLGLFNAKRNLVAQGGEFAARYDAKAAAAITTVTLPLEKKP